MDNEISKMFENAGVVKFEQCDYYKKYKLYCHQTDCKKCTLDVNYRHIYPYFTAEKQIELIKWLASKQYARYTTSLLINIRDTVRFAGGLIAGVCTLNVGYDKQDKEFENALAGLINEMWQDLTDQEKEEIRRILNA